MIQIPRNQPQSGIYPVLNGKVDELKSFALMSEHSIYIYIYIKAEGMSVQQFGKVSGYEKWQRRLGHTTNREIHDTIPYVKGWKNLSTRSTSSTQMRIPYDKKKYAGTWRVPRADQPLKQVNFDYFSSSVVLKDILTQLLSWIVTQDIDGCMAWRPRMIYWKLSRNGTTILQNR
jgi:hypothetical protein